jgi:AraC-like DNA-binding protein
VREALRLKAQFGFTGSASGRVLAQGKRWEARDVVCSSGPHDRPFEERHDWVSVAVVLCGSFTYANECGRRLLSSGALLLGSAGECFTCAHEHGEGDRCLAFHFEPAFFEDIAAASGARRLAFGCNSLPPSRGLAPLTARAAVWLDGKPGRERESSLEELALDLAGAVLRACGGQHRTPAISKRDEGRVTAVVRYLEERFAEPCELSELARLAGLSPFHFLRIFRAATGLTPHQHLLRTRLRAAAAALAATARPITEVALASGFEDLSNFIRSFRAEYGLTPRRYRARHTVR